MCLLGQRCHYFIFIEERQFYRQIRFLIFFKTLNILFLLFQILKSHCIKFPFVSFLQFPFAEVSCPFIINIQLTLGQNQFKLQGSTYLCIESMKVEPQIWRKCRYRGLTIRYRQIFHCLEGQGPNLCTFLEPTLFSFLSLSTIIIVI